MNPYALIRVLLYRCVSLFFFSRVEHIYLGQDADTEKL